MNKEQFEQLKQSYIERIIAGMDTKGLCDCVAATMHLALENYTQEQVLAEIQEYDSSLLEGEA